MAPLQTKKSTKRNARLSMRAVPPSAKLTAINPSLTPIETATLTDLSESKPYSYSVPGSPVSKLTSSLQPSPALSASSEIWHLDINPFLLPPSVYHDNVKSSFLPVVDWGEIQRSQISAKPKHKEKRNKTVESSAIATENPEFRREVEPSQTEKVKDTHEDSYTIHTISQVDSTSVKKIVKTQTSPTTDPSSLDDSCQRITSVALPETKEADKSEISRKEQPVITESSRTPAKRNNIPDNNPLVQPYPQHPSYYPFSGYHGQHYQYQLGIMSNPNGYPPGYPYGGAPPRAGSPYQTPYNGYSGPYPHRRDSPLQRHDSINSKGSNRDDPSPASGLPVGDMGSAIEDDPGDLVSRIASVIPDIHMLLSRSKDAHGELSLRDQLLRKAEAQSAQTVKQKEEHVNQLMKRLQDTEKHHVSECNKYRLQVGNLEDKQKGLEERLIKAELSKKATEDLKKDLEEQKATLLRERITLAKKAAEEKEHVVKELEVWKIKAEKSLDAEEQKAAESITWKKEIEGSFEKMRKDFEMKLHKTQEDLEASIKTERENREQWSAERDTLTKGWEDERARFNKEVEEDRQTLIKQHEDDVAAQTSKNKRETHDLLMSFAKIQEGLNKDYTVEIDNLKQELVKQQEEWDKEREELRNMVQGIKVATDSLEAEKGRLQELVESFGEVTNIQSKGDAYY